MQRTILIPTDFTIESLNLVKHALHAEDAQKLDIILVHGLHLTDSIFDLLFFSRTKNVEKLVNADFEAACTILKNKFATRINSLRCQLFSGFTQSAFINFLEGNRVDQIYIPQTYILQATASNSFDLMPYIKASAVAVAEVHWEPLPHMPEKNLLAELFLL